MRPGEEPLPVQLLRKYIAYARQYVRPRLSDEACEVLQAFYLKLREQVRRCDQRVSFWFDKSGLRV